METRCSSYYTQTISHPCKAGHLVIAINCSYIYIYEYICVCDHQVDFRKKWGFMFALLQLPRWPKSKFWVGMQWTHYTETSWGSKMTEFYTYVPIFSQQFSIHFGAPDCIVGVGVYIPIPPCLIPIVYQSIPIFCWIHSTCLWHILLFWQFRV